ncbi:hypothetical protein [Vibrio phage RYC]|nr:hypothetical protein [Vibrio phage RYC]
MSNNIHSYDIGVRLGDSIKKIEKVQRMSSKFNRNQEKALWRQIALHKQLAAARGDAYQNMKGMPYQKAPKVAGAPSAAAQSKKTDQELTEIARRRQAVNDITKPSGAEDMRKHYQQQEKESAREQRKQENINRTLMERKQLLMSSLQLNKANATASHRELEATTKAKIANAKNLHEVRMILETHRRTSKEIDIQTGKLRQQNFMMQRLNGSAKEFAGNYVSAFALAAGVGGITTVGQNFESVRNTMLAVSEDAEAAGKNFGFVREEAYRLGLDLTEAGRGFAKMLSARGNMSVEDTEAAFSGVAEMSTLLGLSAAESGRAINALQQMMSKGVVSAEELKLQMGEVLPNAIQIMAKSAGEAGLTVNGTVAEMMKLQEQGGLISEKVLPIFAKNMSLAARANGGLDKALESNRVTMNRMLTEMKVAGDLIFRSGFSEGLTQLFNSIAKMLKDNEELWVALGRVFGSVFKALSKGVDFLNRIFQSMGTVLNWLTELFGDFSAVAVGVFSPLTYMMIPKAIAGFSKMGAGLKILGSIMMRVFAVPLLALGALEEIAEFFRPTGKKTLLGFNINDMNDTMGNVAGAVSKTAKAANMGDESQGAKVLEQMHKRQQSTFTLQGDVYLDKEKVGEQVMRSDAANARTSQWVSGYSVGY